MSCVKKLKLDKITLYRIMTIISLVHVVTYFWFWSDGSHLDYMSR